MIQAANPLSNTEVELRYWREEAHRWKANHDNQVKLKAALMDRPDLQERARLVTRLAAERDAAVQELERLRSQSQLTLAALRDANVRRNREWDPADQLDLSFRANEFAGEAGEVCNVVKKLVREKLGLRGSRATQQDLEDELADGQICLDLLAMAAGVDLGAATIRKFNERSRDLGLQTMLEGECLT
jgi:NTP pyrophosphatase (non-canonical NTP hydrolase)